MPALALAERPSYFAKSLACPNKVQRLTGHDVNVPDAAASGRADLLDDDAASSVYSQDQDQDQLQDQNQQPRADYLDHTPGHSRVPSLETDTDGASSRYPSGPPKSPEPGSFGSVRIRASHDDPRFEDTTDEPHPGVLVEQYLMRRWEKGQGRFSDLRAAGEYHHFATCLAGGPPTPGHQEDEEEEQEEQDRSAPTLRHRRVYLPVPLADDASVSCPSLHQQVEEKSSSVPIVSTLLLSSFEVGDRPMRIPDPATRWRPAPKDGGRRSAFDSDSDDDGQGGQGAGAGAFQGAGRSRRHLSMMKSEERPASRNSFFRRSSVVPAPAPPAPDQEDQEDREDREQQQQQQQGGGFLKELFTGARSRARARMRTSMQGPSKADRRRETMRRQIKVLADVEEA